MEERIKRLCHHLTAVTLFVAVVDVVVAVVVLV